MDGSGEQDGEAPAAERDLRPTNKGTGRLTISPAGLVKPTSNTISHSGRSTRLRCTSSKPKKTTPETTDAKSPTRTSLTAAPLTWKWKVCYITGAQRANPDTSTDYRRAFVLLSSFHRSWTVAEYWHSIRFQKKVMRDSVSPQQLFSIQHATIHFCQWVFLKSEKKKWSIKCDTMVVMMSFTFLKGNCKSSTWLDV